ncbi:MAG: ABC transporter ATP-binding protein [Lachnospiraceae bacterium]|nr:ABC transporter ATP-binding protein [Lachnospiraceae bacterium]
METKTVIDIKNVKKKFKGFELSIPDLQIPQGFATALIGENGAGKSTLLNILAGIRLDYKGELRFFDGTASDEEVRERIGYTASSLYFLPHWDAEAIAEAGEVLYESFSKEEFWKLCEDMAITDRKKPIKKLSDGMKMKMMLAATFARKTDLLVLDEPASPLDPLMRDKLCEMIRSYIEEGEGKKSVFFSTHNVADMESVTDYAVIMEKGTVVECGFVEELKEKYILVKGEAADAKRLKELLVGFRESAYGCEGLCLAEHLDHLAGMDVVKETPTLSQICVAVMRQYSLLKSA